MKRHRVQLVTLQEQTKEFKGKDSSALEHAKTPKLNVHLRPKRTVKVSLIARESKGLS